MSDTEEIDPRYPDATLRSPESLKIGDYIIMKDVPCKIRDISFGRGKCRHCARVSIVGIHISNSKKYETIVSYREKIPVFRTVKTEYQLINIDDDYMVLMRADGTIKEDLKFENSSDLVASIKKDFDDEKELIVELVSAGDVEGDISYKEGSLKLEIG